MGPPNDDRTYEHLFDEIVAKYGEMTYNAAYRITQNKHDAEDVVNEVLLEVHQERLLHRKTIKNIEAFLRRSARNRAVSLVRHRDHLPVVDQDIAEMEIPGDMSPERINDWMSVRSVIKQMEPHHVEILYARAVDGQKFKEIAEMMDMPIGTAMSHFARARMVFKRLWNEQSGRQDKPSKDRKRPDQPGLGDVAEA